MPNNQITNDEIADTLDQIADLLDAKNANRFRIKAYRDAAETVKTSEQSIAKLTLNKGQDGLEALPNIGEGIARIIGNYVRTGRSDVLEQLEGEVSPEKLFTQVPGIGDTLAKRIANNLDVSSLQELEEAAHDGRLRKVKGFGKRKVGNIRVSLAAMLSASAQRSIRYSGEDKEAQKQPDVAKLLDVDKEYRQKADAGKLKKIAPKRFNPDDKAWLPILKTQRGKWHFTALYSNTARAHNLGKTHDWVVLYFTPDGKEDQVTVVTETTGPLEGKRVVRGREKECLEYYKNQ